MNKTHSSTLPAYIECTNPRISKFVIRYDITPSASADPASASPTGGSSAGAIPATPYTYYEQIFYHHPTDEEILATLTAHINRQTDTAILTGFTYEGAPVWLSTENQLKYRAAYDLAQLTSGQSLPVTFKLGTDETPVYHTFTTIDALADFIRQMHTHIRTVIEAGWHKKDTIDLTLYHTI